MSIICQLWFKSQNSNLLILLTETTDQLQDLHSGINIEKKLSSVEPAKREEERITLYHKLRTLFTGLLGAILKI